MASKHLRALVPRRPAVRILLLLVVAGVAIGIAGALFSGGETAARDPVVTETAPSPSGAAPATDQSPADNTSTTGARGSEDATTADGATSPPRTDSGNGSASGTAPPAQATEEPPAPEANAVQPPAPETAAGEPSPPPPTAAEPPPPEQDAVEPPAAGPVTDEPPAAEPATAELPASDAAAELIELLRPLVAEPDPNVPDYDRDHFAGWLDSDGDCVNTRHEILHAEAVDFSMNAAGCAVDSGEWFDPYTNRTFTNPRDLDVDHVVALADAWVSGAWAWADELLDNFSNDFGNLNAIAAGENRSKSARGPASYSPTAPEARCDYLVQYATVKIRWELSITPQDFDVVATGLSGCDVGIVPDPPATGRAASSPPAAPPTTVSAQPATDCHPAYQPCLPNLPGNALSCGDLRSDQKPVTVLMPGEDPDKLDRDGDGRGCTG